LRSQSTEHNVVSGYGFSIVLLVGGNMTRVIAAAFAGLSCLTIAHATRAADLYWCEPARAYFPQAQTCPVPWRKVPVPPTAYQQPAPPPVEVPGPCHITATDIRQLTARQCAAALALLDSNAHTRSAAPAASQVQPSPAFQQGLADRADLENWFNSVEGGYHDGVLYWSGQRSLAHPGSCANPAMSQSWQEGCVAAQKRLAHSDQRRRSEPEYKRGWNSWAMQAGDHVVPAPVSPTVKHEGPPAGDDVYPKIELSKAPRIEDDFANLKSLVGTYPSGASFDKDGNLQTSKNGAWKNSVVRSSILSLIGEEEFEKMIAMGPETPLEMHGNWITWSICKEHDCIDWSYHIFANLKYKSISICSLHNDFELSADSKTQVSASYSIRFLSGSFDVQPVERKFTGDGPDLSSSNIYDICNVDFDGDSSLVSPSTLSEHMRDAFEAAKGIMDFDPSKSWYNYDRYGKCIVARFPKSPQQEISMDEQDGFKDEVIIEKRSSIGEPSIVRVGRPLGNGLVNIIIFFRGPNECEGYRAEKQKAEKELN
jgi:hypothetical protein